MAKILNKKQQKQVKKSNNTAIKTKKEEEEEVKENSGEQTNAVTDEESLNSDEVEQDVHDDSGEEEESDEGVGEEEVQSDEEDETQDEFDLNVSDTSSSDGEDDLDEEEEHEEANPVPSKSENISTKIQERYEQFKGKRLYVRFPEKLPEQEDKLQEKAKALSPLIKEVHRPRQKHARFCLVDFVSQADRDAALESIRKAIKNSSDENFKRIVIDVPRTESNDFVQNLVDKKLKTLEKRKANRKLKKVGMIAEQAKKYTSTLVVTNLPRRTSALEVRTAFPKAIDVRIKRNKAAVTFPTTFDARSAYKQRPSVSGIQLNVRFDKSKPRKRKPQIKKLKKEEKNVGDQSVEKKTQKRALHEETAAFETTTKKKKKTTENAESAEIKLVKNSKNLLTNKKVE